MKDEWRKYADKFLSITPREQYLVLATGFIFITFVLYSLCIESNIEALDKTEKTIKELKLTRISNESTIMTYQEALKGDPDINVKQDINAYEKKLAKLDKALLALASDLINPVQMRYALLELLDLQKGVSLTSFELMDVEKMTIDSTETLEQLGNKKAINSTKIENINITDENSHDLDLYRHGIKIKLKGSYFHLRDYLIQLEQLSWKFFWQNFEYNLQAYPESELEIEMYSLSTKQEFIGV